jgi:hypothetical protein
MSTSAPLTLAAQRRIAPCVFVTLACVIAVPVRPSVAQSVVAAQNDTAAARLFLFSVGGGFAKASSTPLNTTTLGYTLQATAALRTPIPLLRIRADGIFSEPGATRVSAFTGSAVLSAPARWAAAPYLMAGGGAYAEQGGRMSAGWNFGAGISVATGGGTRLFMESRIHAYRDPLRGQPYIVPFGATSATHAAYSYLYQPLTFGFRF